MGYREGLRLNGTLRPMANNTDSPPRPADFALNEEGDRIRVALRYEKGWDPRSDSAQELAPDLT